MSVTTSAIDSSCSGPDCLGNSPVIAGVPFYELSTVGEPNPQGFKIVGFRSSTGAPYQIDVRKARLVGLDAAGNIALDTPAINHAVISLHDKQSNLWEIEIVDVGVIPYWAPPFTNTATYWFQVRGATENTDLCPRPPAAGSWPGNIMHGLVSEEDRYDPDKKTVTAIGEKAKHWFNVSCAGSAPAKMHLTRHSEPGAPQSGPVALERRKAMLRAFTAAVCLDSDSFTGQGETIRIAESLGVMPAPAMINHIEALWGPDGAVCLGEQRLLHSNSLRQDIADALVAKIAVQCPNVPSCDTIPNIEDDWINHGLVLTMNPP